jgi:hypothetical protein
MYAVFRAPRGKPHTNNIKERGSRAGVPFGPRAAEAKTTERVTRVTDTRYVVLAFETDSAAPFDAAQGSLRTNCNMYFHGTPKKKGTALPKAKLAKRVGCVSDIRLENETIMNNRNLTH